MIRGHLHQEIMTGGDSSAIMSGSTTVDDALAIAQGEPLTLDDVSTVARGGMTLDGVTVSIIA